MDKTSQFMGLPKPGGRASTPPAQSRDDDRQEPRPSAHKTAHFKGVPRKAAPVVEVTSHSLHRSRMKDPRLCLASEPRSPRAAAFRVLRHHLLARGRPQVVAVTSANHREGKTTCAINLSMALAEHEHARVLLIEANLARPSLAAILKLSPPACFAEQLAAHRQRPLIKWSVVEVPSLGVHVAAVNPRPQSPRTLDAPAFSLAIDHLRRADYDHLIIDCPSVDGSADVNLIQDAADGVLLAVRGRQTTARAIERATHQLAPTKILGFALLH
ncbi:MAG TPA: CpsD/CapB family tyrosine-protein kinase [Kofleriaceae bacterium]|nr:CpsD/CapB family tyrosine-protein kinase [Kofleriaceae bacterium]